MGAHRQIDGKLSILNLNCQCINSKSDKKLFLEGINNNSMPSSVITLQETWADNETDMNLLLLYKHWRIEGGGQGGLGPPPPKIG